MGDDGIRETREGDKLEFRLTALNEYPMDITAAKKITSYLKDVGIGTSSQIMDENAFSTPTTTTPTTTSTSGVGPRTSTPATSSALHHRPDPQRQRLRVRQPAVRRPVHRAVRGRRSGAAAADSSTRCSRSCTRRALLHPLVQHARPGVPHRHLDRVQPRAQGRQDGAAFRNMLRDTYVNLKPVTATETADDSGSNTGVIVAVVVVAGRRRHRRVRAGAGVRRTSRNDAGADEVTRAPGRGRPKGLPRPFARTPR